MSSPKTADWRDGINGRPMLALSENGVHERDKRGSRDEMHCGDDEARSAVEKISDRPAKEARFPRRAS